MPSYLADRALLPDGPARTVRLDIGADGHLTAVTPGAPAGNATRLPGFVIPGMPNLHGHAFQRIMAGLAEGRRDPNDSFWTWRAAMYGLVDQLDPALVEAAAARAYVEMLKAGYTHAVEFHYVHNRPDGSRYAEPDALAHAVRAGRRTAGIGLTLLPTLYRFGGFGERAPEPAQKRFVSDPDAFLARFDRLAAALDPAAPERLGAALHSLRAVAPGDPRAVPEAVHARDPHAPIHIHVAEQPAEVAACRDHHGAPPVAFLMNHAGVDGRWCLIHATHAAPAELREVAASGAVVGLCPTTEANLGDGVVDLPALLDAGGRFGVGSDSHVALDPRSELRTLEYGQRLTRGARTVAASAAQPATGRRLVQAALDGGARAAGAPIGTLEAGARADLVVLDTDQPTLALADDDRLLDAWVFTEHGPTVRDVAVAGAWVVRDGAHPAEAETAEALRRAAAGVAI